MSTQRLFIDKRIECRTERRRKKRAVKSRPTKAHLRRRFESMIRRLTAELCRFDRLRFACDRERQLRLCLGLLETCLEEKPQCSHLRLQKRHCLEALEEVIREPVNACEVEMPVLLSDPEAVRLVLKARLRSPGTALRSGR